MEITPEAIRNPRSQARGNPTKLQTGAMFCAGRCLHSENQGGKRRELQSHKTPQKRIVPSNTSEDLTPSNVRQTMARMRKSLRGDHFLLKISPGVCAIASLSNACAFLRPQCTLEGPRDRRYYASFPHPPRLVSQRKNFRAPRKAKQDKKRQEGKKQCYQPPFCSAPPTSGKNNGPITTWLKRHWLKMTRERQDVLRALVERSETSQYLGGGDKIKCSQLGRRLSH